MKLKTFINAAFIMATLLTTNNAEAQQMTGFEEMKKYIMAEGGRIDRDDLKDRASEMKRQMENRKVQLKAVSMDTILVMESYWTDGRVIIRSFTDDEPSPTFCIAPYRSDIGTRYEFPLSKGYEKTHPKQLVNKQRKTLQLMTAGDEKFLVVRDAQGRAEQVFTAIDHQQAHYTVTNFQLRDLHDAYDGHYRNSKGDDVFFGPKQFYNVKSYNEDPGLFGGIPDGTDGYTDLIYYGAGRVSNGDPSSPNHGKMPGGGGAGAIMGPMSWVLRPALNGIDVKIVHDQKFVDHSPRIRNQEILQFVESPYGDEVPGQWAFVSVRPIGRGMLFRYPKAMLRLIRNEIYARHGHRFTSSPDVQRFFDAKSWYKPSNTPTPLTAIEQLNVQIIKAEEAVRSGEPNDLQSLSPTDRLLSVEFNFQGMRQSFYREFNLSRDEKGRPCLSCKRMNEDVTWVVAESVMQAADSIIQANDLFNLESSYALVLPEGERLLDGMFWSFAARSEKLNVSSLGRNAWPDDKGSEGLHAIEKLLMETAQQYDKQP